jgi:hypothetical protein
VLPGIDLTKALQVADSLEDEEIARKLRTSTRSAADGLIAPGAIDL